jgi:sugar/nucleoside kinase (ribokinase family)
MKRILVVGETNVDVVLHGAALPEAGHEVLADDCVLTLGSASAICAMGLARLGNPVSFVSRVGADIWGDYCIGVLQSAGIDTSGVIRDPGLKTGVTVSISTAGDRALVTYVGSIGTVTEDDVRDSLLLEAAHLHVSSYFLQSRLRPACCRLFVRARANGLSTSLDPGFDPQRKWNGHLHAAVDAVDVFLPNDVELLAMTGRRSAAEALRALDGRRARTVVKLGVSGAMTLEDGCLVHAPAFSVTPVDMTGAGDSFNAGFLHAFLRSQPLVDCLIAGNACGALSTRALGGTAAQPTLEEMTTLVRTALEPR